MSTATRPATDPHAATLATLARVFGDGVFTDVAVPRQPPALRRRRRGCSSCSARSRTQCGFALLAELGGDRLPRLSRAGRGRGSRSITSCSTSTRPSGSSSRRASTTPTRRCPRPSPSGRGPTGWSARSSTCTASRFDRPSRPPPDPDARRVHRLPAPEGLPAPRPRRAAQLPAADARRVVIDRVRHSRSRIVTIRRPRFGDPSIDRPAAQVPDHAGQLARRTRDSAPSPSSSPGRSTSGRSTPRRTRRCAWSWSSTASGSSRRRPTSATCTRASRSSAST